MKILRSKAFQVYAAGLASVFFAAWLTDITRSMVPLAFGGSAAILCTASLVKAIFRRTSA
jgi:hypothetical protein